MRPEILIRGIAYSKVRLIGKRSLLGKCRFIRTFTSTYFPHYFFKYKASKEEQCTVAKDHAKLTSGVVNLIKRYGDDVITVYSEDMIKNPSKEMKRLCKFLSVSCSEDYVKDCSSIVHGSPSKTRNTILWKDEAKDIINKLISDTPMLQRYKFVED